jgi:hypothetical protein
VDAEEREAVEPLDLSRKRPVVVLVVLRLELLQLQLVLPLCHLN